MKKKSKILLVGGHMTPALAVLGEFRKRGYSDFVWVGTKFNQKGNKETSQEFKVVAQEGIKFINLASGKLDRSGSTNRILSAIKAIFSVSIAILRSILILVHNRPAVVVSFGGFLAVPVVVAAKLLLIKVVTHEQTVVAGLAHRIISLFADKVFVSWESSMSYSPAKKTILTGNPIRKEIFARRDDSLIKDFDAKPVLLVMGGNQGAHIINTLIFENLNKLLDDFNIVHQTGNSTVTGDFEKALQLKQTLSGQKYISYEPRQYIGSGEIGAVIQSANLILSRAGANSIYEYLSLGKMCLLIPIPWASHNEQFKNAKLLEEAGLAKVLGEGQNLTSELVYKNLIYAKNQFTRGKSWNEQILSDIQQQAKELVKLDASRVIVDEIEKLVFR